MFFYEHIGWKALSDDVKTLPNKFKLFVALIGSGYQLYYAAVLACIYSIIGHHTSLA